jgi:two-component system sensor histidine kinase BarA
MTTHAFDWVETLKKYGNDEKLAAEITTAFFGELPQAQKAVNSLFEQKKSQKLYEVLHRLHGGCCYVAVPEFKAIVRKFCDVTHHCQKEELENLRFLLDDFNNAYLRLMVYQKGFQQNASS